MLAKTPVYLEWEKLVTASDRSPELQEPAWRQLYETCFDTDIWTVSVNDAGLVTHLGATIMLGLGRFGDASQISERFFSHPEAANLKELDWTDWAVMKLRLGDSKILEGKSDEGLAVYGEVLDSECPHAGRQFLISRRSLIDLFTWGSRECDYAFEDLKVLAIRVWLMRPDSDGEMPIKPLGSVEDLLDLLNSTHPVRG